MSTSLAFEAFNNHHQLLLGIAYRMLGRWSEVEDMVQEVWLRWQTQDATEIQSPKAWLASAMRRLCIDQLRSARHQRETHYGLLAPEPLGAEKDTKPEISAEREESLIRAFTLILEKLKPQERIVFSLREVFGYGYADTAAIVGTGEANCRQIVCRAKAQLLANSTPVPRPSDRSRHLVERLVSAMATGEIGELLAALDDQATIHDCPDGRVIESGLRNYRISDLSTPETLAAA
jgi:RNA polymerase sigma-70 factor (ECF subfamily)